MGLRWTGKHEVKPEVCPECEGCGYVPDPVGTDRLVKQCPTCKGTGARREAA
jgi:DnaJ-class molecular chaperone